MRKQTKTMKYLIPIALLLSATNAFTANSFSTYDVRVIDGDTIEVLPPNQKSERVRLLGIDAPEYNQSYGSSSKATLQQCVANKKLTIQWDKRDQYERMIGKVWANGVDCNLNQLSKGMAWHYKYYANQQSIADRKTYSSIEKAAKNNRIGLWSDANPVNPYNFRKNK